MIQITDEQYNSLVTKIYDSIMAMPDMGMGEMGEVTDEAKRIVDEWIQENNFTLLSADITTEKSETGIYKVTRKEYGNMYVFVKADNPEQAEEIAQEIDAEGWTDCQNYAVDTVAIEAATPEELKGCIVNLESGGYETFKQ